MMRNLLLAMVVSCPLPLTAHAQGVAVEMAPTGALRVGVYPGSPLSMVRDRATNETRGMSAELGDEVARQLGVPVRRIAFRTVAEVVAAMSSGAVDLTVSNASPARAKEVDFSPTLLSLELGYLVPAGSLIASAGEIDRQGVRVGVTKGSTSERTLPGILQHAEIVIVPTVQDVAPMFARGAIVAYATNKPILFETSDGIPGSRVLPGRWGVEHVAIAIPKGREVALAWLRGFVEQARASGLVARTADRAGLRGAATESLPP
ncbi:transporter substrate-binding domain-containing protein [Methylobacterium sp. JK268]